MNDRPQYFLKKNPSISLLNDPFSTLLQVPENVLHVKEIRSYIHSKIESIGDEDIHKDLGTMCHNALSLKFEYAHLRKLNLVKCMFTWSLIIMIEPKLF